MDICTNYTWYNPISD